MVLLFNAIELPKISSTQALDLIDWFKDQFNFIVSTRIKIKIRESAFKVRKSSFFIAVN